MARFDPDRIAVYRLAREHNREVRALTDAVRGTGYSDLVGQLRRSAASIPANVLEGVGEWRPRKRLNYLMIAKGSTYECWAHMDTLVDFGVVSATAIARARDLQGQMSALLVTTIRNLENDQPSGDPPAV